MTYRERICRHFEICDEQIMAMAVTEDEVICVIDYGIAGGKKYRIPLAELEAEIETELPEPDEAPATDGIKATASARALSVEQDIPLILVRGTGKDGRITKADVERFIERGPERKEHT